MGYNTTVVVYNDALDQIESDPQFGAKLVNAIRQMETLRAPDFVLVPAGNHANAAIVIETHHASQTVTVEVGQNFGRVVSARL